MNGLELYTSKSAITPLLLRAQIVVPPPLPPLTASGFCLAMSTALPPASQVLHETDNSSSGSSDQSNSSSISTPRNSRSISPGTEQSVLENDAKAITRRQRSRQIRRSFRREQSVRGLRSANRKSGNHSLNLLNTDSNIDHLRGPDPGSEGNAQDTQTAGPIDTNPSTSTTPPPSNPRHHSPRGTGPMSTHVVPGQSSPASGHITFQAKHKSSCAASKPPQPQGEVSMESCNREHAASVQWQAARAALQILKQGDSSSASLNHSLGEGSAESLGKSHARQSMRGQLHGRKSQKLTTCTSPRSGSVSPRGPLPEGISASACGAPPPCLMRRQSTCRTSRFSVNALPLAQRPEQSTEVAASDGCMASRSFCTSSHGHESRRSGTVSPPVLLVDGSTDAAPSSPLWGPSDNCQDVQRSSEHNAQGAHTSAISGLGKGCQGGHAEVPWQGVSGHKEGKLEPAPFHPQGLPPSRWLPGRQKQKSKLLRPLPVLGGASHLKDTVTLLSLAILYFSGRHMHISSVEADQS
jgi:hypothetical protein